MAKICILATLLELDLYKEPTNSSSAIAAWAEWSSWRVWRSIFSHKLE